MALLNISDPKDRPCVKRRRSKNGSKRGRKKISAEGFDMDCAGRLGSVVKGSQGRLVIGWHQNVCVYVCVRSQAMSEYCKAKYIAPARLLCFQGVDMLPSPCTRVNVDLKHNRRGILFSLGPSTKLTPTPPNPHQHIATTSSAAIQERSHLTLMTTWLSSCLVFNCPMPQGLLGASWAGLNIFSRGTRRGGWQNARGVRCRCGKKRFERGLTS